MIFMQRTPLKDRKLPDYTRGEEIFNMVTHIVGGGLAVVILVACVTVAAIHKNIAGVITSIVYGLSMIMLYTMSSVYHGVPRSYAKKCFKSLTIARSTFDSRNLHAHSGLRADKSQQGGRLDGFRCCMGSCGGSDNADGDRPQKIPCIFDDMLHRHGLVHNLCRRDDLPRVGARGLYTACRGRRALHVRRDTLRTRRKAPLYALGFHIFVILGSLAHFFCIVLYVL